MLEQVTSIDSEYDVALSALQDQVIPQFQRGLFIYMNSSGRGSRGLGTILQQCIHSEP